MDASCMDQLESAVERLLQRNRQLQDQCQKLLGERESWHSQKRDLLAEIDDLLGRLETLRSRQE